MFVDQAATVSENSKWLSLFLSNTISIGCQIIIFHNICSLWTRCFNSLCMVVVVVLLAAWASHSPGM